MPGMLAAVAPVQPPESGVYGRNEPPAGCCGISELYVCKAEVREERMKSSRYAWAMLAAIGTATLTSGCTAIYPIESFFRSPDHVQGLVVDQDDRPVSGATVLFDEWEHVPYVPIPFTATQRFSRTRKSTTDAAGVFALSFKREGLSLKTVDKAGFVFEPCVTPQSWSRRSIPEQRSSPQVGRLLMYRVSGVDTSVVRQVSTPAFAFATDGSEYYLDLVSGRVSPTAMESADLAFSVKQVGAATWLVTVRAVNGGIWASANEKPYAPAGDYIGGFSALYGQGYAIPYRAQYCFFAKTQGGRHFSRIVADLIKKPKTIQFHYVLNPSGSRFLFVPEKVDDRGIHGPPHCEERYHCDFAYVILGEGIPWWRQQDSNFYPLLSPEDFATLMKPGSNDVAGRRYVARQLYAPAAVLDELSRSSTWQERCDVAANPATPVEIMNRLRADPDESVRRQANETLTRGLSIAEYLRSKDCFRRAEGE